MNKHNLIYSERANVIAQRVEEFVRKIIIPYENDPRITSHGPSEELLLEMREKARAANVLTPHILSDGEHLTQLETASVLKCSGLSPLGPLAVNTMSPDEGNMYLLGKVATLEQKKQYLDPMIAGKIRSAFFMSEPWIEGGAGSDPSMLQTTAVREGDSWFINGRKTFITGVNGANVGIIMARTSEVGVKVNSTMFLVQLPNPAIKIERIIDTIDSSMLGGHACVFIDNLRLTTADVLGDVDKGFEYAQIRLSPARLSHCMRWYGSVSRAHEIATNYACKRRAFRKLLIDHEGVGFMLAENEIDLKQAELIIDWCASVLDSGSLGKYESSIAKVAVADALFRVADRCIQVMGGTGVSTDTIVEQIFREIRSFRIYDGPTEVHKWSIARKIKFKTLGKEAYESDNEA